MVCIPKFSLTTVRSYMVNWPVRLVQVGVRAQTGVQCGLSTVCLFCCLGCAPDVCLETTGHLIVLAAVQHSSRGDFGILLYVSSLSMLSVL